MRVSLTGTSASLSGDKGQPLAGSSVFLILSFSRLWASRRKKSPHITQRRRFSKLTNPHIDTLSLRQSTVRPSRVSMHKKAQQPLNPSPSSMSVFFTYKCYYRSRETAAGKQLHRSRRQRRNSQFSSLLLHLRVPEVHGLF